MQSLARWAAVWAAMAVAGCGGGQVEGTEGRARRAQGLEGALELNYATVRGLEGLPGMDGFLAREVVADREANGPFFSLQELSRVPGMHPRQVQRLQGALTVTRCQASTACGQDEACLLEDERAPARGGICYPAITCANVRCASGSCTMKTSCDADACMPQPVCEEPPAAPSCEATLCEEGSVCELREVQCISAPCDPQPTCVPAS